MHSRTPSLDDLEPNACHEAWQEFLRGGGRGYDLTISNPTRAGLPIIEPSADALREAAAAAYQASPQGLDMARAAGVPFAAAGWANDIEQIRNFMRENCGLYFRTVAELRDYLFA